MPSDEPNLLPVAPGYKNVLRVRMAIAGLVLTGIAFIVDRVLLAPEGYGGLLVGTSLVLAIALIIVAPQRIYRRLRYGVGSHLLQVVRGPFDKMFGTASLVVHTAGTHNSVVTVPGLAPGRAAEMRDIIREHVRSDFA